MNQSRRLDRSRDYGEILPRSDAGAFVQDNLIFDSQGYCVHDGPPPKEEPKPADGPPSGAVSLSEGPPPSGGLAPRQLDEWRTMNFKALRQLLLTEKGYKAPNQVAALRFLDSQNLITKD